MWGVTLRHRKANDVEPYAYHKDVLKRMTHGHPMSRIDDLLP
jgi:transposase